MTTIPNIVVELIHIGGPLKGEIQEFSVPEIIIGRHPSCHVQFPKTLKIVSRKHATIVREGNRFKLINHSKNGTYVNGKRMPEAYLKDGDVLLFTEGGPKLSFLTKIKEGEPAVDISTPMTPELPQTPPKMPPLEPPPAPSLQPEPTPAPEPLLQKTPVPLVIQYGPTLQSFKELPVTIGKGPACDFVLDHPSVLDRHIQIFFSGNQYWVKDLTGRQSVFINHRPIDIQAPLNADDQLELSSKGPRFRFLAGGRLAEIEEPVVQTADEEQPAEREMADQAGPKKKRFKKQGSILKKFFS